MTWCRSRFGICRGSRLLLPRSRRCLHLNFESAAACYGRCVDCRFVAGSPSPSQSLLVVDENGGSYPQLVQTGLACSARTGRCEPFLPDLLVCPGGLNRPDASCHFWSGSRASHSAALFVDRNTGGRCRIAGHRSDRCSYRF